MPLVGFEPTISAGERPAAALEPWVGLGRLGLFNNDVNNSDYDNGKWEWMQ